MTAHNDAPSGGAPAAGATPARWCVNPKCFAANAQVGTGDNCTACGQPLAPAMPVPEYATPAREGLPQAAEVTCTQMHRGYRYCSLAPGHDGDCRFDDPQLGTLRETVRRLNRRCQEYEAALAEKLLTAEQVVGSRTFGRMLANGAASMYRARAEKAEAELAALRERDAAPALPEANVIEAGRRYLAPVTPDERQRARFALICAVQDLDAAIAAAAQPRPATEPRTP